MRIFIVLVCLSIFDDSIGIGTAKQSSVSWGGNPNRAIDGNDSGIYDHGSCSHTKGEKSPWWSVAGDRRQKFYGVEITNRADCCSERLQQFEVAVIKHVDNPAKFSIDDVVLSVGAVTFKGKKKFRFPKIRSGSKLVIRFKDTGSIRYLTLCEVIPLMTAADVAGVKNIGDGSVSIAKQSSEAWAGNPNRAIDGNDSGIYDHGSCTHTNRDKSPWWSVDYHKEQKFYGVEIANRADCCSERLQQFEVAVTNAADPANFSTDDVVLTVGASFKGKKKFKFTKTRSGSKLVIRFKDTGSVRYLTLCEVIPLWTAAEVAGL